MHANSFGGTCNWPLKGGARLIEVAATAGGTVMFYIFSTHFVNLQAVNGRYANGTTPPSTTKNCIQLAACGASELLPMNPELPADLFTSCLTTPIKIALRWYVMRIISVMSEYTVDF